MSTNWAEVIGDPIAQSKSPIIHGFWLDRLGMKARYERTLVRRGELPDFFEQRRKDPAWRGCNVTMPHKIETARLLDELDPLAARAGAVNTVANAGGRLVGYNSDATGFLDLLEREVPGHESARYDLIGAGGAGRAVAAAVTGRPLRVFNRTAGTAEDLAAEFGGSGHGLDDLRWKPDSAAPIVVVNASSAGMGDNSPLDIALDAYPPDTVVIDLVYHPLETPLLKQARRLGLPTIDGLALLIAQAARAFTIFFGVQPPREDDDRLRKLLLG